VESFIELDASGGSAPESYTSTETVSELKTFFKQYPVNYEDLLNDAKLEKRKVTQNDLAKTKKSIEENWKLVKYYQTYGFSVLHKETPNGLWIRMRAKVSDIINACSKGV
jgi:DNA polymerase/3'-5' exonuclease PolX